MLPICTFAAETVAPSESKTALEKKAQEKPSGVETKPKVTPVPAPVLTKASGKTLKEKKLSQAFELFIPSEKISADNAVPFPVDI